MRTGSPLASPSVSTSQGRAGQFRAALSWAAAGGDVTVGLRIATGLEQFWMLTDPTEGMHWYERLFAATRAENVPLEDPADSMRSYGSSTDIAGFQEEAGRRYAESLVLYEELGDEQVEPSCSIGFPSRDAERRSRQGA